MRVVFPSARLRAGQPLPAGFRTRAEDLLGADFSGVRLHFGPTPTGAEAVTTGDDILISSPASVSDWLLSHELAHVVQQRLSAEILDRFGDDGDPFEQEAEAASRALASARPFRIARAARVPRCQSAPPRRRRRTLSPSRHLPGHSDHPGLLAARSRYRHHFGLAPLHLHLGLPEFQLMVGDRLPPGLRVSLLPRTVPGSAAPAFSVPSSRGVSLAPPSTPGSPFRVDVSRDVNVGGSLNRPGGAAPSADVAVSLVYELDAVSFGQCRTDEGGQEYCLVDFLHEPTGTVTVNLTGMEGQALMWAATAGITVFDWHVLRDQRNQDRLELGLPVGFSYQVDPTGASTVSAQAGLSAEVHVTHSVSVVVSGNVTFTPDDHGVNVGAGGTASILIHGN
jgi:hypothetical protein